VEFAKRWLLRRAAKAMMAAARNAPARAA